MGFIPDEIIKMYKDPPPEKPKGGDKSKLYAAAQRARAKGFDVPDDVVEDFAGVWNHESGRSHFNKDGSVKRGIVTPSGEQAIGGGQVMPGTARPYQSKGLDPFDETDNIAISLSEFYKGDPSDGVARRLAYVGGPKSKALAHYRKTGEVPDWKLYSYLPDNKETYRSYVEGSGGRRSKKTPVSFQSLDDVFAAYGATGDPAAAPPPQTFDDIVAMYSGASEAAPSKSVSVAKSPTQAPAAAEPLPPGFRDTPDPAYMKSLETPPSDPLEKAANRIANTPSVSAMIGSDSPAPMDFSRMDEVRATTPQPKPTTEMIGSLGVVGDAAKAGIKAPVKPINRTYRKSAAPKYEFEQTGKTKDGGEYLGMVGDTYHFRDPDGDEFRIEDPATGKMDYISERKRAFDADKNEYLLADQSGAKGGVRRTRNGTNYIFTPDGKIAEENPALKFEDGTVQSANQDKVPKGFVRMEREGKKILAKQGKDGGYITIPEADFGKAGKAAKKIAIRPDATPSATDAAEGYQDWLDYTKRTPSPEALREYKAAVKSAGPGKIESSATVGTVSESASTGQPEQSVNEFLEFNLKNKPAGVGAKDFVDQETASRLSGKYGVPYDETLRILRKYPAKVEGGGDADNKYYESLFASGSGYTATTIGGDVLRDIKGIPAKQKKVGELKEQYKSKYPEALSDLAEIDALVDVGDADRNVADEIIKTETEAYNKWLAENPDVTGPSDEAYKGTYDRATQGGIKQRQAEAKSAYQSKTAEIRQEYGSFKNYFAEKQRIEKEYENRPMARPTEFALNIGRYFLKLPATAVKALGAGGDILSSTGIDPKENPFIQAGKDWEKRVDASKNPDFKKEMVVNDLAQGAGQLIAQGILLPLTGGASIALPLVEGGVGAYETAAEGGANHSQRSLAGPVGMLAAAPGALLNLKYLRFLTPVAKTQFVNNLTKSLFGHLAKEVGEAEAKVLTRTAVTSFVKKAGTGYFGERGEEGFERMVNKTLAKATYKPALTWEEVLTPTADEARGEQAAGILGIFGGSFEAATQQMSNAELRKYPSAIEEALRTDRIKADVARELRLAAAEEMKSRGLSPLAPDDLETKIQQVEKDVANRNAPKVGSRVTTPKGEGVIVEDRGKKVLVDYNDGASSAEFRKNQIEPVLLSNEKPQENQASEPEAAATTGLVSNKPPVKETITLDTLAGGTPIVGTDPAYEAATSPENDLPEPTEAQREAGNFKMGHINIGGLDITVENPVGSERKGKNREGKEWSRTMEHHYGYIKRTIGADTENIDLFVKDGTPEDYAGDVYVVDQVRPDTGKFDEHKVLLGYNSEEEARAAYLSNYAKDWKGLKSITAIPFDQFKKWAREGEKTRPIAEIPLDGKTAGSERIATPVARPSQAGKRYDRLTVEPPTRNASAAVAAGSSERPLRSASPFYSQVEKVITDKMPENASAEQVRGVIQNAAGVKKAETEWLDIDGFLKSQAEFTKQDVVNYVRANAVRVKQSTLAEPKYAQHQLPGESSNYQEHFVTAPDAPGKWNDGHKEYADIANPVMRLRTADRVDGDGKNLLVEEFQPPKESETGKMPPILQKYAYQIGLKAALRMAVEGGYKKLLFTTGEQQAGRSDIAGHLGSVEYRAAGLNGDKYSVRAFDKSGRPILSDVFDQAGLESSYGKKIADLIIENATAQTKILDGSSLKTGEGLRALYDNILPAQFNRILKQFGGKVESTGIDVGGGKTETVHSITITPQMGDIGEAGQSLFKVRDEEGEALLGDKMPQASPEEVLRGIESTPRGEDLELNENAAEIIRRLMGEEQYREHGTVGPNPAFEGMVWATGYAGKLVEIGRDMELDFRRAGYTAKEMRAYNDLLDNIEQTANISDDYAIIYVFDDALPEEEFHKEDLRLGRADVDALAKLKDSPLWKNPGAEFNRQYPGISDEDKASEIAAKLATDQAKNYGWDKIADFAREKKNFLETWLDGVLRKHAEEIESKGAAEVLARFKRVGELYAEIKGDHEGRRSDNRGAQRADRSSGEKDDREGDASGGPLQSKTPANRGDSPDAGKVQPSEREAAENVRPDGDRAPETAQERRVETPEDVGREVDSYIADSSRQAEESVREAVPSKFQQTLENTGRGVFTPSHHFPDTMEGWKDGAEVIIAEKGIDGAKTAYFTDENIPLKIKNALGLALVDYYGQQGDLVEMNAVGGDLIQNATAFGQAVKAFDLANRYDPQSWSFLAQKYKAQSENGAELTPEEYEKGKERVERYAQHADDLDLIEQGLKPVPERTKAQEDFNKSVDKIIQRVENPRPIGEKEFQPRLDELKKEVERLTKELDKLRKPRNQTPGKAATLLADIRARKDENKKILQAFISQTIPGAPVLKKVANYNINAEDTGLTEDVFSALRDIVTEDLLNVLPEGQKSYHLYTKDLDAKTGNKLTPRQIDQVIAAAVSEIRATREHNLTPEQLSKQIYRREFYGKAQQVLGEKGREHAQRVREAIANAEASPTDAFAKQMVQTAANLGMTGKELIGANVLKITNNLTTWRRMVRDLFPGIPQKELEQLYKSSYDLKSATVQDLKRLRAENSAEKRLTDKEYKELQDQKKTAIHKMMRARAELEEYYHSLTRTKAQKIGRGISQGANIFRSIQASFDLSYAGRQGAALNTMETRASMKGLAGGLLHSFTQKEFDNFVYEMENDPIANEMRNLGWSTRAVLKNPKDFEEFYLSQLPMKLADIDAKSSLGKAAAYVPKLVGEGFKISERSFELQGDMQGYHVFSKWRPQLEQMLADDPKFDIDKAKRHLIRVINAGTGRGNFEMVFGKGGNLQQFLSELAYSPRFMLSRPEFVAYTNPVGLAAAPAGARKILAKRSMKMYGAFAALLMPLAALGISSLDPEDDEFMQIRVGDMKWDVTGKLHEPLRALFMLGKGVYYYALSQQDDPVEQKTGKAGMERLASYYTDGNDWLHYLRAKLSPQASLVVDWWTGSDFLGRPFTWTGALSTRLVPLAFQNAWNSLVYDEKESLMRSPITFESFKKNLDKTLSGENNKNIPRLLLSAPADFGGISSSSYSKEPNTIADKEAQRLMSATYGPKTADEQLAEKERDIEGTPKFRVTSAMIRLKRMGHDITKDLEKYKAAGQLDDEDIEAINKRSEKLWIEDKMDKSSTDDLIQVLRFTTPYESFMRPWASRNDQNREKERERLLKLLEVKAHNANKSGDLDADELKRIKDVLPNIDIKLKSEVRAEIDSHVREGRAAKSSPDFQKKITKLVDDGKIAKEDETRIYGRIDLGDDISAIKSGTPEEAVKAFEGAMKSASDEEKQAAKDELADKYYRADGAESKKAYREAAKKYGLNLDDEP